MNTMTGKNQLTGEKDRAASPSPEVERIEIEAVVGGALQRIILGAGTNPAEVRGWLLGLDPSAKVRDDFPARGNFGAGGHREAKKARAFALSAKLGGKFTEIALMATSPDGDAVTVVVSRKNLDAFPGQLLALGRLGEKNQALFEKAVAASKDVALRFSDAEAFGVRYFEAEGGKCYLEGLDAEPPAE